MLDLRLSSFLLFVEWSYYLNWHAKNGLILFNPVFSVRLVYFFLNQAIVLTQIISMVIIITGLLLTNKKSMTLDL
jgi:drug/metabolite transporter (DMT)-like permease